MRDGPRDRTGEVTCRLVSLRAAQSAATSYDNKAQILGIGSVLSIRAIWSITLAALLIVLMPLILFGHVL